MTTFYTYPQQTPYKIDQGKVICTLNPRIVPHLIGLREKFSSYPLSNAVNFSSSYTWRFYELMVSWAQPKSKTGGRFVGWFEEDIDELRKMLGVPDSYNMARFRKMVLEIAVTELKEKAGIDVAIERKKTGRKYTKISVKFLEDDQLSINFDQDHTPSPQHKDPEPPPYDESDIPG